MDKFLSVPVTGQTNFLLSVSDVIAITRSNDTTSIVTYNSGNTATLTHGTVASALEMRDSLQNAMTLALETSWTNVVAAYVPAQAVSAIAIA
jgi:hypothetical protein|tara:strand:- start:1306 stop:1581 length:276 start_codon:yes stop_codon:yes gene_type:complete